VSVIGTRFNNRSDVAVKTQVVVQDDAQ